MDSLFASIGRDGVGPLGRGLFVDSLETRLLYATGLAFSAARPDGSRAYLADATASVATGAAQDFTFTLPAAQSLGVAVAPTNGSTLRSHVRVLRAGDFAVLGDVTAGSAGATATLQPIALPAGSYVIRVDGAASTSGGFALAAQLNAGFEAEAPGAHANDDRATAINLDAAPILLQGGGRLKAVTGVADGRNGADLYRLELDAGQSLGALLGTAGGGGGQFGTRRQVDAPAAGSVVRVADMNGDGRLDLIVGGDGDDFEAPTLSVLLDNGDGTYAARTWATERGVSDLEIADFDKDGDLDVAVVEPSPSVAYDPTSPAETDGHVRVFFNLGNGSVGPGTYETTVEGAPRSLAVGDFDHDGRTDVAVGMFSTDEGGGGDVATILNLGNRSFGFQRRFSTDAPVFDLQAADLDRDGFDDLAIATGDPSAGGGSIEIALTSTSFPGFPRSLQRIDYDASIVNLAVGDLNGDGTLDLIGLRNGSAGEAEVLFTDGNGSLRGSYRTDLAFGNGFGELAEVGLVDLNRDGLLDVVTSHDGNGTDADGVSVSLNPGDGYFFGSIQQYSAGVATRGFAFADLNGDGDQDLIAVSDDVTYGFDDDDNEIPLSRLAILTGRGDVTMSLLDASGATVALSTSAGGGADAAILDFVAPSRAFYYVRVTGDAGQRYALAAAAGARLGLEPDVVGGRAPNLAGSRQAAARIGDVGDTDGYAVALAAGDVIRATVIARGNGTGAPALVPALELVAPDGTTVVAVDNNGDLDATAAFDFTLATAGTYTLRVRARSGAGDYDVRITGGALTPPPMTITSRSPAPGAFVTYQPVVSVSFSLPVLSTSLQPGDLLINGVAAAGVVQTGGDSVYFTDPRLGTDGTFTVSIADGAVTGTNGQPLVGQTWSFGVDANGPRVVRSTLADGQTLAPGPVTWKVGFNEKLLNVVDLGFFGQIILGGDDVVLTNRSSNVTSYATSLSQDDYTVGLDYNFTLGDLVEGAYEGRLLSGYASFQDLYRHLLDGETNAALPSGDGVEGGDFVVNFVVDAPGTTALPPLVARGPKGSLVHETSTLRAFHATGDVDAFGIDLDAGQAITLALEPSAGGAATTRLELFDPSGARLAIAEGAAGEPILLNLVAGTTGGTYRIVATSLGGLAGYTLRAIVNAAVERESVGVDNGTRATAEAITLAPLVGGGGSRGAAVGTAGDADEDYYRVDLAAGQAASFALSASAGDATFRLFDAGGNLITRGAGGSANFDGGAIDFVAPAAGTYYVVVAGVDASYTLLVTRGASIERDAVDAAVPAQDLTRTGQVLGSLGRSGSTAAAIRVAHVGADGAGAASGTYDPNRLIAQLNDDTYRNFTATRVAAADVDTLAELDKYDVVVIGRDANVARAGFAAALTQWVNAGGSLVVSGYGVYSITDPALRALLPATYESAFVTSASGTVEVNGVGHPATQGLGSFAVNDELDFAVAVAGDATVLATSGGRPAVVVRSVGFGGRTVFLAPDYGSAYATSASLRGGSGDRLLEQAVAWAGASGDRQDDYTLSLAAGNTVTLTTSTPNDETGQPVNLIDPILDLYAPDGTLVATNDNGAGGRNARIVYAVPAGKAGVYRVVVRALNVEGGTYTLQAGGGTAAPAVVPTTVIATSPANGATSPAAPTTIDVTLSANVLAASVQPGDLTLAGGTVTGATLVDGRTVRFTVVSPNVEGTYAYALAAGAFTDLQGNATAAYAGNFKLDRSGPRVVSVTPPEASAPFTGWTITFDEAIDAATFTGADVVSITRPGGASILSSLRTITVNGSTVTVEIAPQSISGTYTLVFGPNIADRFGNLMDQDADGVGGESVQDRYAATTLVASPNLVVDAVTVVNAAVFGQSVTVRWTVRNAGTDPATTAWQDQLVLSTDATFGGDTVLATLPAMTVPLAAGASYTREHTFALPLTAALAAGSYRFIVRADSNARQLESSETDNDRASAATTVSLPPLPDLAVSNVEIISPADPRTGAPATIRWTLTNLGTAAASGVIRETFALSTDAAEGGGDASLGGADYNVNLAAGQSVVRTAQVTLPVNQFGTRYVIVHTDANDVLFEHANEANNVGVSAARTITLSPLTDLVVTDIVAPATATAGATVPITWTLANGGTSDWTGTITEVIYLSDDATIGNDVRYKSVTFTGTIAAGASIQRTASITLPVSLSGTFRTVVVTDANNDVFENAGESNNATIDAQTTVVTLPPTPDLFVVDVTAPTTTLGGRNLPVSWTLKNIGAAKFSGTFVEKVYLSADAAIGNDQLFGTFTFTGTLAAGQSVARSQSISLPNVYAGSYRVVVVTDANNAVFENAGESNNATIDDRVLVVSQAPYANLKVENVVAPRTALSSEQVAVSWTTRNVGAAGTNASQWFDKVYISNDATLGSTDTQIATFANASYLNAGESFRRTETVTLPRGLQGDYYVIVLTDGGNAVFEYQPGLDAEADNAATSSTIAITLAAPPDLQVTSVVGPVVAFSGSPASVSWTVANRGGGPTRAGETLWYDVVYLSKDRTFDGADTMLGESTHVGGLAPGASYSASGQYRLPTGISGPYYFIVRTDVGSRVYEDAFESNNSTAETSATDVRLTPPPDLAVASVAAPAAATAGRQLVVNYRVNNDGATATPVDAWTDRLYLSPTATFDAATAITLSSRGRSGALAAGAGYDASFSATVPLNLEGTYYVFVLSDVDDKVFEADNANNLRRATASVAVTKQFADLRIASFAPPSPAAAGTLVPFAWTIVNGGVGDTIAAEWRDRVTLSADNVLGNADDVTLGNVLHKGLLAPGGSYNVAASLAIPASVVAGNYFVFLRADADGSVPESNEANNSNAQAPAVITVGRVLPDLRVDSITAPATATDGTSVPVSFTVRNRGGAATTASSWIDEIWLSADATISSDDARLRRAQHTNGLGVDGFYDVATFVTLPADLTGTYFLIARTDADDVVVEGEGESNNDRAATATTITLRPTPDLAVTSVVAPAEAYAGQATTVTWTVRNVGTAAASGRWYDSVYLSLDGVFDSGDVSLGAIDLTDYTQPGYNRTVAVGESYTRSLSVGLPPGASGPYTFLIVSDSTGKIFERDSETNNIGRPAAATDVQLLPPADLVAGTVLVPVNGSPGRSASITYTIRNDSTQAALGRWNDSLFLSADANWDLGDQLFARAEHVGNLAAGASYTATVTAALPGVTPGEYYLIVRSDIGNQVPESDEANNLVASLDRVLLDVPTLALGVPQSGSLGKNQAVYYRVTVGAGETLLVDFDAATSSGSTQLYVKYGDVPTRADFDFGYADANAADQKILVPKTRAGTYYVLAYGDGLAVPTDFNVVARTLAFEVVNDAFGTGGNGGNLTVQVDGAKLDRTVIATLVDAAGNERAAQQMWYRTSVRLYATFDLRGLSPGNYDVRFSKPGAAASVVEDGLRVVAGKSGQAKPTLFSPNFTLPGATFQFTVNWGNDGLNDVAAPLIVAGANRPISGAPDGDSAPSFTFVGVGQDDGPAGILRPGQTSQRTYYVNSGEKGTETRLFADRLGNDPNAIFDYAKIRGQLAGGTEFTDDEFDALFARLMADVGNTWGDYLAALSRSASLIPIRLGNNRVASSVLHVDVLRASAEISTSLTGRATLPDVDVPIANRDVVAVNRATGAIFSTVSLNDGTFILDRLAPGTYDLSFDGATVVAGGSFAVADGQHLTGHTLALARGAGLNGIVRTAANLPIADAVVTAYNGVGFTATATTAADGSYRFDGLAPGTYTLFVDAPGLARGVAADVAVGADDSVGANFALAAEARVRGTVVSPVGPDSPLSVVARRLGERGAAFSFNAALVGGAFDAANVPAGDYELTIRRGGYVTQTRSVSLAAGQTLDLGTLTIARAATIGGTVTSTDAKSPVAYVRVGLYSGQTLVDSASADGFGAYRFDDVLAGAYSVRPILTNGFVDPASVTVATGQALAGVGLTIRPGGVIAGVLRTGAGGVVAGAAITLRLPDGGRHTAITGADGAYRFDRLPRGAYVVLVSNAPTSANVTSLDPTPVVVDLSLPVAGVIVGTLRDSAGLPVAGAVRLYQNGRFVGTATTNAQGRYHALLATAGTFDLYAESATAGFAPLTGVSVGNGATLTRDFVGGNASLRLRLGGPGVAGAVVQVRRVESGHAIDAGSVSSPASGIVDFGNLRPGTYEVLVIGTAATGARREIVVAGGTPTDVAVTLTSEGIVRGRITSAAGAAIGNARIYLYDAASPGSGPLLGATRGSGEYAIDHVRPGTYDAYVVADGFALATRVGIVVDATGSTQIADATLTASTSRISGRLVDAAGRPVLGGGAVTITSADGAIALGSTIVADDGTFELRGPSGADLRIVITTRGAAPLTLEHQAVTAGGSLALGNLTTSVVLYATGALPAGATPAAANASAALVSAGTAGTTALVAASKPSAAKATAVAAAPTAVPLASLLSLPGFINEALAKIDSALRLGEVGYGDVPGLDKCKHCIDAQLAVFGDIRRTGHLWDSVDAYRNQLRQNVTEAGQAFALDATRTAGILAGLVILADGVASFAIVLGGAEVGVGGGIGLGQAGTAITVLNSVASIGGLIANVVQSLYTASMSNTVDKAIDELLAAKNSLFSITSLVTNTITLISKFLQTTAADFVNGGVGTFAELLNLCVNFQSVLDTVSFQLLDKVLVDLKRNEDALADVYDRYKKQNFKTFKTLTAYKTCLRNADQECDNPDPDPEEPPSDDFRFVSVPNSLDPNDITGPVGFGPQQFVSAAAPLGYAIRFENDAAATAPARHVTITQTFDDDLDARTFRLGDFGFGGRYFSVPADSAFYQTRIDLREARGIYLDVIAGVDVSTRQAFWEFIAVDPATGDVPTNPLLGFLPANATSPEGEGFVRYAIRARAGSTTGTVVDALATIVFDENAPIDTPAIFHTLDAVAAASAVRPIVAPAAGATDFAVEWSGADDAGGSAIASYDVYVAVDGKPFTLWLDDATLTAATYRGEAGHAYAFYSVATDNAGNVEAAPAAADASVRVPGGNVTPTVDVGAAAASVAEGVAFGRAGSVFDADVGDVLRVEVDYDDGLGFRSVGVAADGTFALSATYGDDATHDVVVRVTDAANARSQQTIRVNVANRPPTIAEIADVELVSDGAGASLTVRATVADVPADALTAQVDFGDGAGFVAVPVAADRSITLAHRYGAAGTYAVAVRVADDDGGIATRTFNVRVLPPKPVATGLIVNAPGEAQRSIVSSLTLNFDAGVELTTGAVTLYRRTAGGARVAVGDVTLTVARATTDGRSWRVTFAGAGVIGGSLADGVYELDLAGPSVAAATFVFHRLFGDSNGDKTVDAVDDVAFKASYRASRGQPAYLASMDYDGNGVIDRLDDAAFRARNKIAYVY